MMIKTNKWEIKSAGTLYILSSPVHIALLGQLLPLIVRYLNVKRRQKGRERENPPQALLINNTMAHISYDWTCAT